MLSHGDQIWVLHDKEGGDADDLAISVVLDPQPAGDAGGTWTLNVSDNAGQDTGTLDSWSVTVTP